MNLPDIREGELSEGYRRTERKAGRGLGEETSEWKEGCQKLNYLVRIRMRGRTKKRL